VQDSVDALDHALPNVVEQIGEERQRAAVLVDSSAVRSAICAASPSVAKRADRISAGRLTTSRSAASRNGGTSIGRRTPEERRSVAHRRNRRAGS
jgi:hypothetical protein